MTRSSRLLATAFVALIVIGAASAGAVFAHGGATGIVKHRMELMKGIGEAMKTLSAVFKGEVEYDSDAVREAARTIRSRAGEHITKLFPEGSLDKPTEALPMVWEDWATFERYANDLETYSTVLEAAAGNELGPMHGGGMGRAPMMGSRDSGWVMSEPGRGPMMGGQRPGPMMGGEGSSSDHPMNDPEVLRKMPPMASFMRLSQTCNACHTRFRVKK